MSTFKIPPNEILNLSDHEQKQLTLIAGRKGKTVDESMTYVSHYLEMKLLGIMAFQILHSHVTWSKAKKLFKEYDIPVDDFPKYTEIGKNINAIRWHQKIVGSTNRLSDVLRKINRSQEDFKKLT